MKDLVFSAAEWPSGHPLEDLRARWFPESGDTTWETWVRSVRGEYRPLLELAHDPKTQPSFAARALVVLLSPTDRLPIFWIKQDFGDDPRRTSRRISSDVHLEKVAPELWPLAAELVHYAHTIALHHYGRDPNSLSNLHFASRYMVELFGLLPVASTKRLWEIFNINDINAFWDMDDASGYNPWLHLMRNPKVPLQLKQSADTLLRVVVENERVGRSKPRAQHEDALSCYISHINNMLFGVRHGQPFPYDVQLLADQIAYLVVRNSGQGREIIAPFNLATTLALLEERQYMSVRYQLARQTINQKDGYVIYDDQSMAAAATLLSLVVEQDPVATAKITAAIEVGRARLNENLRTRNETQQRQKALMAQMQRPPETLH